MILNEYLESQTDKHNFLFPTKSVSPTPIEQTDILIPNKTKRNSTNLLVKFRDPSISRKSPSPIIDGNKSNQKISSSKLNNLFHHFKKDQSQSPAKRTNKSITNNTPINLNQQIQPPPSVLKPTNTIGVRKSVVDNDIEFNDQHTNDYEHDDIRIINEYVHEYYYAVRILPGQNPRSVFIGWTTSRFKPIHGLDDISINKLTKLIRHCTITKTDNDGLIIENMRRQDAYMFCASDLLDNMTDKENVARRVVNGLLIGCLCDVSTGQLTFYVNGKESTQKLQVIDCRHQCLCYLNYIQVEPTTKLYPAVFVEPTVKEVLQFELGRIKVRLIEECTIISLVL
jgi:hypothetical protein